MADNIPGHSNSTPAIWALITSVSRLWLQTSPCPPNWLSLSTHGLLPRIVQHFNSCGVLNFERSLCVFWWSLLLYRQPSSSCILLNEFLFKISKYRRIASQVDTINRNHCYRRSVLTLSRRPTKISLKLRMLAKLVTPTNIVELGYNGTTFPNWKIRLENSSESSRQRSCIRLIELPEALCPLMGISFARLIRLNLDQYFWMKSEFNKFN